MRATLLLAALAALVACSPDEKQACERAGGRWQTTIIPGIDPRVGKFPGDVTPPVTVSECKK